MRRERLAGPGRIIALPARRLSLRVGQLVLISTGAALLGCSESAAPLPNPMNWEVVEAPTVTIGSGLEVETGVALYGISGAVRLDDGRIVVADRAPRVLVFDPDGEYLHGFGRRGEGPGEFQRIRSIQLLSPDSLLVLDASSGRASFFTLDGGFVRSMPPPQQGQWVGRLGDGTMVSRRNALPAGQPRGRTGIQRMFATLVRHDLDGRPLDTLGVFPADEFLMAANGTFHSGGILHTLQLSVGRTSVYVASSDLFEVQRVSVDGNPLTTITKSHQPLEISTSSLEGSNWANSSRLIEDLPPGSGPSTFPAVAALLIDNDGNLWVEEFPIDSTSVGRWWIFDPEGALAAQAKMPEGFRPTDIGSDYVLGVKRDSLDIERVQLHGLRKTGDQRIGPE